VTTTLFWICRNSN